LTVAPCYAADIARGVKTIEYRTWRPGPALPFLLLVHAARPESRIVAVVDVVGVEREGDVWAWKLAHVRRLRRAVPAVGRLGLWRVPDDLLAAVRAQLDRPAA
jgi:predicted transcriptional regulator